MSAAVREFSIASTESGATTIISADYGSADHMLGEPTIGPNPETLLGIGLTQREGAAVAASSGLDGLAVAALGQPANAGGDDDQTPQSVCGEFGIYQGNWGGNSRNPQLRAHVLRDVCFTNPCQVICAQEVDPEFVAALVRGGVLDPEGRVQDGEAALEESRMHPGRKWRQGSWLVVAGEEGGKTNVIAAKPSRFSTVEVLEWHKSADETYHVKNRRRRGRGDAPPRQAVAFSRVLVAELFFVKPWCGRDSVKIMNVHMHHRTAKKSLRSESTLKFFQGLFHVIQRHRPHLMCGDFNMSLFQVLEAFRGHFEPVLLASYAWRLVDGEAIPEGSEDSSDDSVVPPPPPPPPAVAVRGTLPPGVPPMPRRAVPGALVPAVAAPQPPGPPPPKPQQAGAAVAAPQPPVPSPPPPLVDVAGVRFDSCGIFSLVPITSLRSPFTVRVLDGGEATDALRVFPKGQGYLVKSYVGGEAAFRATMAHQEVAVAASRNVTSPFPGCHQKHVDPDLFDKLGLLFRGGAHMPLMTFLGHGAFRSAEAKQRRHAKQNRQEGKGKGKNKGKNTGKMPADAEQGPPPVVMGGGSSACRQPSAGDHASNRYPWSWSGHVW